MHPSILITNGGPHTAATWANLTAERLLPIDDPRIPVAERISPERRPLALRLQAAIAEALIPHHAEAQQEERDHLSAKGLARLEEPHDIVHCLEAAMADIRAAAEGTPWQAHFWDPSVEEVVRQEIASHLTTSQQVERQWHCDGADPAHPAVIAYRASIAGATLVQET